MKNFLFVALILFTIHTAFSQAWVVGDTTGYLKVDVSTQFLPDSKVVFDMDCDGIEDINISSSGPVDITWPWSRLSFFMKENVACVMLDPGFITAFETGDTVLLSDESIYEVNLDYICGYGAMGGYGQCNLEEKYFIFRKKTPLDTHYIFIMFSNFNIDFTIHHIISKCSTNPIDVITSIEEVSAQNDISIFPNPTKQLLNLPIETQELKIYTMDGIVVLSQKNVRQNIDVSHLDKGMYILELMVNKEKRILKFVKE